MTTIRNRRNRFVELTFAPIRERFAVKHGISADDDPSTVLDLLAYFAAAPRVAPELLTLVTSATICEFLGVSPDTWRWWCSHDNHGGIGVPPPPRDPGGPQRGPGVPDLWLLELDIIPWLLSTPAGTARLAAVITDIQSGLVRPVFNGSVRYPKIVGYTTSTGGQDGEQGD
jgi:hypothetical protein